MDIRRILIIAMDDLRINTVMSAMFYLLSSILLLASIYSSKTLQLLSFMIYTNEANLSFYHLLAEPTIRYILPLVIALMIYDKVAKDIRTGRLRLILSRSQREEYIIAKYLSSIALSVFLFLSLISFVNIYSYFAIGIVYFAYSGNLLLSSIVASLFYISVMLLISCEFSRPLPMIILFYIISFLLSFFPYTAKFSIFTHIVSDKLQIAAIVLVLSATAIIMLSTIHHFQTKNV